MKFVEIVLFVMIINLSFAGVTSLGLDFQTKAIDPKAERLSSYTDERLTADGIVCADKKEDMTLACKTQLQYDIEKGKTFNDNDVKKEGVLSTVSELFKGLTMFKDLLVKGLILPGSTYTQFFEAGDCSKSDSCEADSKLRSVGIIINILMGFLYMLSIIHIMTGRTVEAS